MNRRKTVVALGIGVAVVAAAIALANSGRFETRAPQAVAADPATAGATTGPQAAATLPVEGCLLTPQGKVLPPATGAYMGLFRHDAPYDVNMLDTMPSLADRPQAIVMWFQSWDPAGRPSFDASAVADVLSRGAVPLITWEPWNPGGDPNYLENPANQPQYRLSRIISGEFDGYIRSWAQAIKQVDGPVMLRPMHEMNGTWYPWGGTVNSNTPARFREAWRHIHDVFRAEGVTNVTWVWSINHVSVPNTTENRYAAYYPGDSYVDWVSISGFNWGTTRDGITWRTFDEIYAKPLAYLKNDSGPQGKPVILSEFGSVSKGGDKPGWITDSYARIKAIPEIDAVIYYDKREVGLKGDQDWQITSSWESWQAYRASVADRYFIGGAPPQADAGSW